MRLRHNYAEQYEKEPSAPEHPTLRSSSAGVGGGAAAAAPAPA